MVVVAAVVPLVAVAAVEALVVVVAEVDGLAAGYVWRPPHTRPRPRALGGGGRGGRGRAGGQGGVQPVQQVVVHIVQQLEQGGQDRVNQIFIHTIGYISRYNTEVKYRRKYYPG